MSKQRWLTELIPAVLEDRLVYGGVVPQKAFRKAVTRARSTGKTLTQALVETGTVDEYKLLVILGNLYGMPVTARRAKRLPTHMSLLKDFPEAVMRECGVVPTVRGSVACLAISDPLDMDLVNRLWAVLKCQLPFVLAPRSVIQNTIDHVYGPLKQVSIEDLVEVFGEKH